jgi:signal transduction histidine kinase
MGWAATPFAVLGFGAAAVSAMLAVPAWRQRSEPGSWPFFGLILSLIAWSLCYAVQFGTSDPVFVWHRLGLAAGAFVPPLWLLFCLQYTGHSDHVTALGATLLAIEPVVFAVMALTNPQHGLLWTGADVVPVAGGFVADVSLAAGYFLHYVYAYLLLGGGFALLFSVFVNGSSLSRKQTGLLMLGPLPPLVMNTAFTFGISWGPLPGFDATPFAFVVTAVVFGLALFRFDLLERTPFARRHIIDQMGDGLLVLNAAGEVEDVNETARSVVDPTPTDGDDLAELASVDAATPSELCERIDGETVTAMVDGKERAYDVECSRLREHADRVAGYVVALREVTERRQYEQRLEVAQRVLRHNLRNDLTVVKGWAEELEDRADDDTTELGARNIRETAEDLVDLSEKTRTMVKLDDYGTGERVPVDVSAVVRDAVAAFRDEHPEVSVAVDAPTSVTLDVPSDAFVSVPVENLVENAIEHNDTDAPEVTVSVAERSDEMAVTVSDNGPPIPDIEQRVLEEGDEDPLTHGSGVGLWLTEWSVSRVGGTVEFEPGEPRGNEVTLTYPAVEA